MSVDQFEEAKEANQNWKYANKQKLAESWTTAMGSSLQKIESRIEKSFGIVW